MKSARSKQTKCLFAEYLSLSRQSVTQESNAAQNGRNIYREGAKYAKGTNNREDNFSIQILQDFLSDLRTFAVPSSRSGLSGLGIRRE